MSPSTSTVVLRLRRSAWPLAVAAALIIGVINEVAYERSTKVLMNLGDRASARAEIHGVWRSLIDAETGQRGYLLTGIAEHRLAAEQAAAGVQQALDWLAVYYRDDVEATPVLATIVTHAQRKLSEMETTVALFDRGSPGAWREVQMTDIGREQMDDLRKGLAQLLQIETRRVAEERGSVLSTLQRGRLGVSALTVLALLALLVLVWKQRAVARAQRDNSLAMQTHRDRLQTEAGHRTADLTDLARNLHSEREDERGRLARELHDELGALLTAAKLDGARLRRVIAQPGPGVQAGLDHLSDSVNQGIAVKRRIIEELRPSALDMLGLVAALEILAGEHAARNEVQVSCDLQAVQLDGSANIAIYRLVQEALVNAAKYARARHLAVELRPQVQCGSSGAHVAVLDDGIGFDPQATPGHTHGLMGMRYWIEAEGGTMEASSRPGEGSRIQAWLPTTRPASAMP